MGKALGQAIRFIFFENQLIFVAHINRETTN